jgi:antitoxin ParD1/3/4
MKGKEWGIGQRSDFMLLSDDPRRAAMQNAEKISITMTPEMMQVIRASVASGEFASTSEVMRDAVRIWQRERQEHAERLDAIRQRVRSAVDDTRPNLSAPQVQERLQDLHAQTVKAHAVKALPLKAAGRAAV